MNIKLILKEELIRVLKKLDIDFDENKILIEKPKIKENGDYSTNLAMQLTKVLKKSPNEIANMIIEKLDNEILLKVEVAGPGFINFHLKKEILFNKINEINEKKDDYGKINIGQNKKINVEYVSANPTGILHLGTARGAAYGDNLCNILEFAGYKPVREYYINDAGNQINILGKSILIRYKQLFGSEEELDENSYHGKEIIEIANKIKEEYKDQKLNENIDFFKEYGLNFLLDRIKKDLKKFKIDFDIWTSEKEIRKKGRIDECLSKFKNNNEIYEEDGATYLKTTKCGDDKDRVLIKSDGSYTYFTPDIAYHLDKYDRNYDMLIDVFGADHHGYVKRLKSAIDLLGYDSNKLTVKLLQMVRLIKDKKEIKMSKRTGKTVTITELIDDVGIDVARYFFAMRSLDTQMDFDMDLALEKSNDNPVYYIEYAHARICSILRESEKRKIKISTKFDSINLDNAYNMISKVSEFENIVEESANKLSPHIIANYVYELAGEFHSFYAKEKILSDDIENASQNLALISAVEITIKNALNLIGVNAIERM